MGIDAQMFVRCGAMSDKDILKLSYRICEAIGHDIFWIQKGDKSWHEGQKRHALSRVDRYEQDGPDIVPACGEIFIEVNLWLRYYGEGYERGPLHRIVMVAEWLERNIPGGEVWYGGDSSGVLAKPFGPKTRSELMGHWATHGHSPYAEFDLDCECNPATPHCDMCDHPMRRYGWGGTYAAYYCPGCGEDIHTRDNGKTWTTKKQAEAEGQELREQARVRQAITALDGVSRLIQCGLCLNDN
jgi:hypothetical protein